MDMRGFSNYTKDSYYRKAKDVIKYFDKPMEEGKRFCQSLTEEVRNYNLIEAKTIKKYSE